MTAKKQTDKEILDELIKKLEKKVDRFIEQVEELTLIIDALRAKQQ